MRIDKTFAFAVALAERMALLGTVSLTGWLNAALDLQVIDPALNKMPDSPGRLKNEDTAVVAGLRLYVRL
jgi:hypothetical protein